MKKINLLLAAVITASTVAAADTTVNRFMVRTTPVPALILTDTVDALGSRIDDAVILKTKINTALADAPYTTMEADTLFFDTPSSRHALHLVGANVWADRFTPATFTLTTTAPAEIYVDNVLQNTKTAVQHSADAAGKLTASVDMEPMRLYHISVKLLGSATDSCTTAMHLSVTDTDDKANIHFSTDDRRYYMLTDNFIGTRVTDAQISPCGKYLLSSYTARTSTKDAISYKVLTDVKSGKVLMPRLDSDMEWMPRSSKLCYTAATTNGYDVIAIDPATMGETVVAHNIPQEHFLWSPDEKHLIFSIRESARKNQGALIYHASPMDRVDGRMRSHIALYDIATATTVRLTAGNHSAHPHDMTRDGKKILFATYTTDYSHRQQVHVDLYQIDVTTMRVDTLLTRQWHLNTANYSPDGTRLLITAGPDAFDGIGRNCAPHAIANDYDAQAYIFDIATKKITPITRDFDPNVRFIAWNDNGKIYFHATERDLTAIYEYNPASDRFTRINAETEMVTKFSLDHNGSMAAYIGRGMNHSTRAYLYDMRRMRSTLVADPMAPIYENIRLGKVEDFNFTYDSTDIDGYICYPPQFDPTRKYPMIVYYYGGTTPSQRWNEYYYGAHLFASRGYIVYVVNPSGTVGYGQEFSARHVNAWGRRTADEIIYGTRLVCRRHEYVDSTRIGCIGASYGGFMTQYLQTRTDLFACAVSHAGISDVTSYWGEGYWGVGYNTVAAAESYPWNNPELFTQQGSLFNADKINTPLLLLHGNKDTNVPIGESIQLYNALKIQNKIVEFIEVDGENHTIVADLDKQILWHNTIMAWFARWLQDAPEWWDTLYPKVMTE